MLDGCWKVFQEKSPDGEKVLALPVPAHTAPFQMIGARGIWFLFRCRKSTDFRKKERKKERGWNHIVDHKQTYLLPILWLHASQQRR